MPEEEYEVHGHHDDAVEEAAEHGRPFGRRVALFSAILATLGAIASFLGGHTQNEALYHKNDAVLLKARASDAWAYYQAEDVKRHLAETQAALKPGGDATASAAKYKARAAALQDQARDLDRQSEDADREAVHALAPHTKLALAVTFIQIAIALASIAALTSRAWLLRTAMVFGGIGAVLGVIAWL